MICVRNMDMLNLSLCLGFVYILSGKKSVSGCVTQQFSSNKLVLSLSCPIQNFNNFGSWNLDGSEKTSCLSDGTCTTVTNGIYTFTSDLNGIYLKIDPYSSAEVGKVWVCNHSPISCNITVEPPQSTSKPSEDSSDTGAIVGGTAGGAVLVIGTGGAIYKRIKDKKEKEGSDEEQNKDKKDKKKDKKDKKKDKKDKKKDSDEEQDKVEHVEESQPKHKSTDKKIQNDGTNDSLLNKELPSNKLPPLDLKEIKKGKEQETHEIKTK